MAKTKAQARIAVAEPPKQAETRTGTGRTVEERIRARAYQIFESRIDGGSAGDPISDWLQAESEVRRPRKTNRS